MDILIISSLTDYVNLCYYLFGARLFMLVYPFIQTQGELHVVAPFVVKQKVKQRRFRIHQCLKINA